MSQLSNQSNQSKPGGSGRPFTVRTVVLMLVAAVVGATIGILTYMGAQPIPTAIVAGLVSGGATFVGAHTLIREDCP